MHWLVNRFNEFCSNNQLEKYIVDIDRLPRFSKYCEEAFRDAEMINSEKQ